MNQDLMALILETICLKNKGCIYCNVTNIDKYAGISTHWIALFCDRREIVYFNSFGVEHVPE